MMSSGRAESGLAELRRIFEDRAGGVPDRELLERFRRSGDEAAFTAIVERHGPVVARVARSILRRPADVDDAFQATFLILARRPGAIRDGDRLGPWLLGVSRRVALRAKVQARRRGDREAGAPAELASLPDRAGAIDPARLEIGRLVVNELERLPRVEALAVALCDLDGLSQREAADRLGWPLGTVKTRVARGRDRLRSRLSRRGLAPALPWLGEALAREGAEAALLTRTLAGPTARVAGLVATGRAVPAGLLAPGAWKLARRVGRALLVAPGSLAVAGLGIVLAAVGAVPGAPAVPNAEPSPTRASAPATPVPPARTDGAGVRFERTVIDPAVRDARRVEVADMDGDGRPDLLVVGAETIAWYRNPTWTRHIVTAGGNPVGLPIVDASAADADGDGRAELAIAADSPEDDPKRGQVLLVRPGAGPDAPWTVAKLRDLPTVGHVRWVDLDDDHRPELVATIRGVPTKDRHRNDPEAPGIAIHTLNPADLSVGRVTTLRSRAYGQISALEIVSPPVSEQGFRVTIAGDRGVWSLLMDPLVVGLGHVSTEPILGQLVRAARPVDPGDPRGILALRIGRGGPPGFFAVGIGPNPRASLTVWEYHEWSPLPPRTEDDPEGAARRANALIERVKKVLDHDRFSATPLSSREDGRCVAVADLDGDGTDEILAGYGGEGRRIVRYRREGEGWVGMDLDATLAPVDLREGDLDGDGVPDLVALDAAGPGLVWYRTVRPDRAAAPR